jgi:beta propeller repeat protein
VSRSTRTAALLLALAAPLAARALPSGELRWIVVAPGDQTGPAIDGPYVVYADRSGPDWDVLLFDLVRSEVTPIASGPGDQSSPDVFRSAIAYRVPGGVAVHSISTHGVLRAIADPRVAGGPATSDAVVAWDRTTEDGSGLDVAFARLAPPAGDGVLGGPGDQHAAAVFGDWVGLVDDADGGAVRLVSSATGEVRAVCAGRATGVAMDGPRDGPRVVVAREATAGDADIEVYDRPGVLLAALRVPGTQRNPHVSGDWVAFEDVATGHSQVVLWNLATGEAFVPHPSASDQILNDVSAEAGASVRVVFADDAHGDLDLALFTLPLPVADDGAPPNWPSAPPPARCGDPGALVLGEVAVVRAEGRPLVQHVTVPGGPGERKVLVCVDAVGVTSGWVALGNDLVAGPEAFGKRNLRIERVLTLAPGGGRLAAVAAGGPGAALRVRVLGGAVPLLVCEGPGCDRQVFPPHQGCATAGAGLAPLGLILVALRRRRR